MNEHHTTKQAHPVKLGATGPEVFPLGLGCRGMSGMYGATDDAESVATIAAAIDAEAKIFPVLAELGISATLYGIFSRGLLTGSKPQGKGDFRAYLPRFKGDHREQNDALVAALASFARERDLTPGQLAIAWVLARQPALVPVVGAKNRTQLADALGALAVRAASPCAPASPEGARTSPDRRSGSARRAP